MSFVVTGGTWRVEADLVCKGGFTIPVTALLKVRTRGGKCIVTFPKVEARKADSVSLPPSPAAKERT